jgi:hypothetical protein
MSRGVRLGIDFLLRQRSKPYVSGKLFVEYINIIFISCLKDRRDSEELEPCKAVLVMDNSSLHISDDFVSVLTRVRVRVIIFASHMTHIFQMFDVILFSALKRHAIRLENLDEEQPAAAFLFKVYHDFKQTVIEVNAWGAFAVIGFTYETMQNPYGRLFDAEKLRQSPGFVELSERDPPLESLSKHR